MTTFSLEEEKEEAPNQESRWNRRLEKLEEKNFEVDRENKRLKKFETLSEKQEEEIVSLKQQVTQLEADKQSLFASDEDNEKRISQLRQEGEEKEKNLIEQFEKSKKSYEKEIKRLKVYENFYNEQKRREEEELERKNVLPSCPKCGEKSENFRGIKIDRKTSRQWIFDLCSSCNHMWDVRVYRVKFHRESFFNGNDGTFEAIQKLPLDTNPLPESAQK